MGEIGFEQKESDQVQTNVVQRARLQASVGGDRDVVHIASGDARGVNNCRRYISSGQVDLFETRQTTPLTVYLSCFSL